MIHGNISVNEKNHLCFNGADTVYLAEKYKTPLYLIDEDRINEKCGLISELTEKYFPDGSFSIVASKALPLKKVYEISDKNNLGADVVSGGELFVAENSGFPLKKIIFHGNAKSKEEIETAISKKIGFFAVDNLTELGRISKIAEKKGIVQDILLRLTPGIDTDTYDAVNTGKVDSKFGIPIETGDALNAFKIAINSKGVNLRGFHCHVGSQVFDSKTFVDSSKIMLQFIAKIKKEFNFETEFLDLGGGFGVRYVEGDKELNVENTFREISESIEKTCKELNITFPKIILEPGRFIAADAGMTLYSVENVKEIKDYKNYVAIDGGMTDNPRYALYQSKYTLYLASRADDKADFVCDVVGKCCESGDIIQPKVTLPKPKIDEIIAVAVTGAYNYSMSSNYNYNLRPAVVGIKNSKDSLIVERQSMEDFIKYQL